MKKVKIFAVLYLLIFPLTASASFTEHGIRNQSTQNHLNKYSDEPKFCRIKASWLDTNYTKKYFEIPDSIASILKNTNSSSFIDALDTLSINLSESIISGNYIEFPVMFYSDDIIYALDFSLKFNEQVVEFDSIINITQGLNYLYYLNPLDSTLRFTSYSLGPLQNDTAIIKLRFTSLNGKVCTSDLYDISGYLNGDNCSINVTECDITSTSNENNLFTNFLSVFPNPADKVVEIFLKENYAFQIIDYNGKIVLTSGISNYESSNKIDVSNFSNGFYILKITTTNKSYYEKLLIQH